MDELIELDQVAAGVAEGALGTAELQRRRLAAQAPGGSLRIMDTQTQVTRIVLLCALLGACTMDPAEDIVGSKSSAVALGHDTEEAGREAVALYLELAERLDDRGVTVEEMQAAVDAGDAERARELLGFAPEEFDAEMDRLMDVAAQDADPSAMPTVPDGLVCNGPALLLCTVGAAERAIRYPKSAIVVFVVGEALCAWVSCSWDHTDPGPDRSSS